MKEGDDPMKPTSDYPPGGKGFGIATVTGSFW